MFGFDTLSNLRQLNALKQYIDISKLPDLMAAGLPLAKADCSTMDGARAAVVTALGLVCPFTDITITEKDAILCRLAGTVAGSGLAVSAAAFAVYAAFGRRTRSGGEPVVLDQDIEELHAALIQELSPPEGTSPDARAKFMIPDFAKVMQLVEVIVQLLRMFQS